MEKAKHTSGPWEITGFTDCQLITKDVPPAIGQPIPIGRTYGANQIANARLIAAAPELLNALMEIIAPHVDDDGIVDPKSAPTIVSRTSLDELVLKGSFMTLLERARAVIAKATAG